MTGKDEGAFRTIGEVAESLDLPAHVLRFWETRFSEIEPVKRAGGRRYYRPRDVELVAAIRHLLYGRGYTIKGVQRLLREQGVRAVIDNVRSGALDPRVGDLHADAEPPSLFARVEVLEGAPEPEPRAGAALVAITPREPTTLTLPVVRLSEAHSGGLGQQDTRRLREALADISECRRMLLLTVR